MSDQKRANRSRNVLLFTLAMACWIATAGASSGPGISDDPEPVSGIRLAVVDGPEPIGNRIGDIISDGPDPISGVISDCPDPISSSTVAAVDDGPDPISGVIGDAPNPIDPVELVIIIENDPDVVQLAIIYLATAR